jgi:hypothetical protein
VYLTSIFAMQRPVTVPVTMGTAVHVRKTDDGICLRLRSEVG